MTYAYKYPHPAVTVDAVVFGVDLQCEEPELEVLVIERADEPFKGHWALPGGFVNKDEAPRTAAARELREETGLTDVYLEQLYTFGEPGRDPREWVISVAHYALVDRTTHKPSAGSDARAAQWTPVHVVQDCKLAFDHNTILSVAVTRLRNKIGYAPVGLELLPAHFTLHQVQRLYEVILDRQLDTANFRRKFLALDLVVQVGMQKKVSHRPAAIYRVDKKRYAALLSTGFNPLV